MKKIFTTLVAVFAIAQISYGQWTNAGGTGNYYLTSGNAGVGTTTPGSLLHISSTSAVDMLRLQYNNGSNGGNWAINPYLYGVSNGGLSFVDKQHSTTPFVIADNGNIGIGTTSPGGLLTLNSSNLTDLQINRAASKYARVLFSTAGSIKWYIGMDNDVTPGNESFVIEDPTSVKFAIAPSGKVGVGIAAPLANLHVNGSGTVSETIQTTSGDNNSVGLTIKGGSTNANWAIVTNSSATSGAGDDLFFYKGAGTVGPKMVFKDNGYVGIGTTAPDAKLTVNGTIHSTDVVVDNSILPDYVFESNYKLLSLKQVKAYIDKNHHLPEVPSAQEVAKDGLKLVEMNNILLKKVEELTLYLIEKDKQEDDHKKQLAEQQKINKSLQHQINKLAEKKIK